jgi:hypothetical protein
LKPGNAKSVHFNGYLEVPASGAYRFYIQRDHKDIDCELHFTHLPKSLFLDSESKKFQGKLEFSEYMELKAGVPYLFSFKSGNLQNGNAQLMVQSETLPKDSLSQLKLYPASTMQRGEHAFSLLSKVLLLLQKMEFNEREIRYLLTHPKDFDGLDLSQLPTIQIAGNDDLGSKLFNQFLRLVNYKQLKDELAGGDDTLISVFELNEVNKLEKVYELIAKLTRRDVDTIKNTSGTLFLQPNFANEKTLRRLWQALQIIERFGVSVASLHGSLAIVAPQTKPEQRFAIARDLKQAIKARFEQDAWQRVAQPIFDKLRQQQRDALVAYLLHKLHFERIEQLYEHFLIDPGMEPVVQTSRIRLAISSVQLFIQRCLLNLERHVSPASIINAKHWEWMKRYRVWEANRKIFLFPENWLEPEFRDDKTHLFTELEGALLQGDVSNDLADDAFLKYLQSLEELARLDIIATHYEYEPGKVNKLHVFGRTFSQPYKYFYRSYHEEMWTPWEPVTAEVEGIHLAPVIWRGRLYLFWMTFMDKPDENAQLGDSAKGDLARANLSSLRDDLKKVSNTKNIEVKLHWSEYVKRAWSTSLSSNILSPLISKTVKKSFKPETISIHVSTYPPGTTIKNSGDGGVYIHLGGKIEESFYLAGRNCIPALFKYKHGISDSTGTSPSADNIPPGGGSTGLAFPQIKTVFTKKESNASRYSVANGLKVSSTYTDNSASNTSQPLTVLRKSYENTSRCHLIPCDNEISLSVSTEVVATIKSSQDEIASLSKPIFYQDNAHTFFIEPSVTERYISNYQRWLPPIEEAEVHPPEAKVMPEFIRRPPIPEEYIGNLLGDGLLHQFEPGGDLFVNKITTFLFEKNLIGPRGQTGLDVMTELEASSTAMHGESVNVHPGSGLAADTTVVVTNATAFEGTGLVKSAAGMNIIGQAGYNSSLAQNYQDFTQSGVGVTRSQARNTGDRT